MVIIVFCKSLKVLFQAIALSLKLVLHYILYLISEVHVFIELGKNSIKLCTCLTIYFSFCKKLSLCLKSQRNYLLVHKYIISLQGRKKSIIIRRYRFNINLNFFRNDTHKNDVLSFCQQKAKACSENIDMTDRESAELIWRLLEVLIKQNGVSVIIK